MYTNTEQSETRYYPPYTAHIRITEASLEASKLYQGWVSPEVEFLRRIAPRLDQMEPLQRIGVVGGDLVAVSDPSLGFVVKFPYESNRLPSRVRGGYSLAKDNLRGILTPSISCVATITDEEGLQTTGDIIIQKKIRIASEVLQGLRAIVDNPRILQLKNQFIRLNYRMWARGVFDRDSDWEGNYGFDELDEIFVTDFGDLSDDPKEYFEVEGRPRSSCYEPYIWGALNEVLFRQIFGQLSLAARYASYTDQRNSIDDLIPIEAIIGSSFKYYLD